MNIKKSYVSMYKPKVNLSKKIATNVMMVVYAAVLAIIGALVVYGIITLLLYIVR